MSGSIEALPHRKFLWLAAVIVLLALLLREQFVLMTDVKFPIQGDITHYVYYAQNLLHSGVFSSVAPGTGPLTPDDFRGPGFPVFLSAMMALRPDGDDWYSLALQAQVVLGSLTVLLAMALGRFWLSRGATLAAGLLVAIWPHHIAATGALLSELVFGAILMLASWSTAVAARSGGRNWALFAGSAFAAAYLVNPITLLFPPIMALVLWRRARPLALSLLLVPALVAAGWSWRGLDLPDQHKPGRATINFVQGSWPTMHQAYVFRRLDPVAADIMRKIEAEQNLLATSPRLGLAAMAQRMETDPLAYARWYVGKPYLLWDWDIRIGYGDVYFQTTEHSPLETNPILHGLKQGLRLLNPVIFGLSALAALAYLLPLRRLRNANPAPVLVAAFCVYATLVHAILQAEPRYSISYRPFQMLLVVSAIGIALQWLKRFQLRSKRDDGAVSASDLG